MYRIRHLDRDRTGSERGRGLAGYIRVEMETLAKIFSVPEITNMPPTRRVHSFSANGSGMKLLKPIPFETSRFPNGGNLPPPLQTGKLSNSVLAGFGVREESNYVLHFRGQDRKIRIACN